MGKTNTLFKKVWLESLVLRTGYVVGPGTLKVQVPQPAQPELAIVLVNRSKTDLTDRHTRSTSSLRLC
jgi:hypothetical protein